MGINQQQGIPPQSIQSERSLLGGLLIDANALDEALDVVTAEDFYNANHAKIYRAILTLEERSDPVDVVTVSDYLESTGENVDMVYLNSLASDSTGIAYVGTYAKTIRDKAIERKLLESAYSIEGIIHGPGETREKADKCEATILAAVENRDTTQAKRMADICGAVIDRIEERMNHEGSVTGLSTGFERLDRRTSGLQRGNLVIIAGRPSMGKTTLAMNIAESMAIDNSKTVAVYTVEMSEEEITQNTTCSIAGVDNKHVKTGELNDDELTRLTNATAKLAGANIFVDQTGDITALQIRSRARKLKRQHGLDLIIIDYLQLLNIPQDKGENFTNAVGRVTRQLKLAAKELDVPIILISQLNRDLERRADKRPTMADLRDSGAIEQDADIIWFVYRDEKYNENTPDIGLAEIITAKFRNGETGKDTLEFEGKYNRFTNTPKVCQARSGRNKRGFDGE